MSTVACINCVYTISIPIVGILAIVGSLMINCFKCFFLKFKRKHEKDCNCHCHKKHKEKS